MYLKSFVVMSLIVFSFSMDVLNQVGSVSDQVAELCELQSEPQSFLGKKVEVKAKYTAGLEMGWLEPLDSCPKRKQSKAILYLFDGGFEKATEKRVYSRFRRQLKRSGPSRTVRGVFQVTVEPYNKANEMDSRFEFQFRVLRVLSVD